MEEWGGKLKTFKSFDSILWSASAFVDNPEIVTAVHKFIDAGSTVITTNNYTVVPSI